MSSDSCSQCPRLRARIAELERIIGALRRHIEFLRAVLARLLGGVKATLTFIDQEMAEPTMPRKDMIGAVQARLTYCVEVTEGERV